MNKKEIEHILKNYYWMINSIKIMYNDVRANVTSQYGDESTLPKPQGINSDTVFNDVVRRSKYWKRIEEYEQKVKVIQERIHVIEDDREIEVLNWILEGKGYSWIARHMGLSERHIRRIKDSIVKQMSEMPKTPNKTNTLVS